jgi:hypothetical protein
MGPLAMRRLLFFVAVTVVDEGFGVFVTFAGEPGGID